MSATRIDEIDRSRPEDVAAFESLSRPGPTGAGTPPLDDARLLVVRSGDSVVARASIRVADALTGAPGCTGLIGHYEARDAAAGVAVLGRAMELLAADGVDRIVGPMDGTTWDRYRLALPAPGTGEPAPFLTEPTNPPEYPSHWEAAGLEVAEWYVSQLVEELDVLAERARDPARSIEERGLTVASLDPTRYDDALIELHRLSLSAFADNPYYSPITLERFRALYGPMKDALDPELVLVARKGNDDAVGFVLAFPDLLDPAGKPTRVVVKTLAVTPAGRGIGLGSLLTHEVHRRAAEQGYTAAIHALMHVRNDSLKISSHGGRVYRHYALYGSGVKG